MGGFASSKATAELLIANRSEAVVVNPRENRIIRSFDIFIGPNK